MWFIGRFITNLSLWIFGASPPFARDAHKEFHWFSIPPLQQSILFRKNTFFTNLFVFQALSEHKDYCERCVPGESWKRKICVIMLFTPLSFPLSLPASLTSFSPFGFSCMSNYQKIYAFSDQLICSLSNDFSTFLSFSWFILQKNEKFSRAKIKKLNNVNGTKIDVVRNFFAAARRWIKNRFWLTDLHSTGWMSMKSSRSFRNRLLISRNNCNWPWCMLEA